MIFRKRPSISPGELKNLRPRQNPVVVEERLEDGTLVLAITFEDQRKGTLARLAKWAKAPDVKRYEVEEIGAFVWARCDGQHTFEKISRNLQETYKMNRMESETALAAFLQMLGQRGLIQAESSKKADPTKKADPAKKR